MIFHKRADSKKTLLLFLTLALASPCAQLLAAESQEAIIQEPEKELTEPPLGFWHWFFAAGDLVTVGAAKTIQYYATEAISKALPEKPLLPETQAQIHQIIHNNGIDPDTIIVKGTDVPKPSPAAALGKNAMLIDPEQIQNTSKEELEFVVGHELAHLKHNHNIKQAALLLTLPFISHFGLKAWDAGVHNLLSGIKHTLGVTKDSRTDKVISKIDGINHWLSTFCLTKCVVAWQIFNAYSRYCEKQADLTAIEHLKTAEGAEKFFKQAQKEYISMRETNPLNRLAINPEGDFNMPLTHPTASERIRYTKEYAQTL